MTQETFLSSIWGVLLTAQSLIRNRDKPVTLEFHAVPAPNRGAARAGAAIA